MKQLSVVAAEPQAEQIPNQTLNVVELSQQLRSELMDTNYSYPLDPEWNQQQLLAVMAIFNLTEDAYETKLKVADFQKAWQEYQKLFPAKMDQRQIDREFKRVSGYSIYAVQQAVAQAKGATIKMK